MNAFVRVVHEKLKKKTTNVDAAAAYCSDATLLTLSSRFSEELNTRLLLRMYVSGKSMYRYLLWLSLYSCRYGHLILGALKTAVLTA